jgi:hypothetical protein
MNAREAADHHPGCRARHGQRCTCGLDPTPVRVELGHIFANDDVVRVVRVTEKDGTAHDITLSGPDRGKAVPAPPVPAIDGYRQPTFIGGGGVPLSVRVHLTDGRILYVVLDRVNEYLRAEYEGNVALVVPPQLPVTIDDGA